MQETTIQRVEETISKQTGQEPDFDVALAEFDSLDRIQLACDLEEEFNVKISDGHLNRALTVNEIAEYIDSLVAA